MSKKVICNRIVTALIAVLPALVAKSAVAAPGFTEDPVTYTPTFQIDYLGQQLPLYLHVGFAENDPKCGAAPASSSVIITTYNLDDVVAHGPNRKNQDPAQSFEVGGSDSKIVLNTNPQVARDSIDIQVIPDTSWFRSDPGIEFPLSDIKNGCQLALYFRDDAGHTSMVGLPIVEGPAGVQTFDLVLNGKKSSK